MRLRKDGQPDLRSRAGREAAAAAKVQTAAARVRRELRKEATKPPAAPAAAPSKVDNGAVRLDLGLGRVATVRPLSDGTIKVRTAGPSTRGRQAVAMRLTPGKVQLLAGALARAAAVARGGQ